MDNLVDPHGWNSYIFSKPVLANAHWLQKLLKQNFARMSWGKVSHGITSMIVSYFDVIHAVLMPFKANPPLIVNPNTVLPFPLSLQCFQVVCRRNPKVVKVSGSMDHNQFPFGNPLNVLRQFAGKTSIKYLFRLFAFECLNHRNILIQKDNIVKGYYVLNYFISGGLLCRLRIAASFLTTSSS
jgi:hypothetical protein